MIPIKTEIRSNQNLLEYLREKGYELPSPCGGKGICGKCRVRILEGIKTLAMPYTGFHEITLDEWEKGWRLACKTRLDEEMVIEIDDLWNKEADILVSGNYDVNLQPYSRKIFLDLNKPSISDQRSDGERILSELGDAEYLDLELVKTLPEILRDRDYRVTVILFGKTITGIESGNTTDKHYGAAVDIGTTTIAGSLINLNNGDEIGTFSMLNPQKNFGDDVITRINYTI
ncbi:MAG: 2Fe-2S iron-sulfur cluster binding domain-containing protein [Clostridiales bacterium]|nr:2Fe-2S iron-sulfur cluster binding domain-containing protein [Clostridiales bacterium]